MPFEPKLTANDHLLKEAKKRFKKNHAPKLNAYPAKEIEELLTELEYYRLQAETEKSIDITEKKDDGIDNTKADFPADVLGMGYFRLTNSHHIVTANNAGVAFFNLKTHQIKGNKFTNLLDGENAAAYTQFAEKLIKSTLPQTLTLKIQSAGKPAKYIRLSACNQTNCNGYSLYCDDQTELNLAKIQLEISNQKYKALFENIQDVYYEASADGTLLEISPSIFNLSKGQYTREMLLGASMHNFYTNPDDRIRFFNELLLYKNISDFELLLKNKDGSEVPISVSTKLWMDELGNPIKLTGTIRDISLRKSVEQALRLSEEKFAKAFFTSPYSILITRASDGKIVDANPSFSQISGYTHEEAITSTTKLLSIWKNEQDREYVINELKQGKSIHNREFIFLVKGGKPIDTLFSASIIMLDSVPHVLSSILDITEQKKSESALKQSELKYRTLFETMAQGVVYMGKEGYISSANPAALKLLGLSAAQLAGKKSIDKLWHTIHEDGSSYPTQNHPAVKALQTGKTVQDILGVFDVKNQSYKWVKVIAKPEFSNGETEPYQVFATLEDITKLKEVHDTLNKTNHNLEKLVEQRTKDLRRVSLLQKAILENVQLGIITTDASGIILTFNPAAVKMLGYAPDELVGKHSPLVFHDFDELKATHQTLTGITNADNKQTLEFIMQYMHLKTTEWTLVRKDKTRFNAKISHSSWKNEKGETEGYIGVILDVTLEKHSNETLKQREAYLSAIIENQPGMIWLKDTKSRFLAVNQKFADSCGIHKPEDLTGKNDFDIWPAELAEAYRADDLRVIETRTPSVVQEYINIDGELFWFETFKSAVMNERGEIIGTTGYAHNITERKRNEAALKMQSAAFESFALAIIITDEKGKIQWANTGFSKLTGYTLIEATGKTPGELLHSTKQDEAFYKKFWHDLLYNGGWSGEIWNRRKDGSAYLEEETITSVRDVDGKIVNFIAIKIDITERKKLEQGLMKTLEKEKELNVLKSKFISVASHEFRTPLANILASSETLTAYWNRMDAEQRQQRLDTIKMQIRRLESYINEMLHLSRLQAKEKALRPELFDLTDLIKQIVAEITESKEFTSRVIFESNQPSVTVELDKNSISAMLTNLISNALKYSDSDTKVSISLSWHGSSVSIEVEDRGIGMDNEELKHIFEPFYRASNVGNLQGTGLGLNIVKEVVERHNGKISVTSQQNVGSKFTVELPIALTN